MCGFRPLPEIAAFLETKPQLRAVVGEHGGGGVHLAVLTHVAQRRSSSCSTHTTPLRCICPE